MSATLEESDAHLSARQTFHRRELAMMRNVRRTGSKRVALAAEFREQIAVGERNHQLEIQRLRTLLAERKFNTLEFKAYTQVNLPGLVHFLHLQKTSEDQLDNIPIEDLRFHVGHFLLTHSGNPQQLQIETDRLAGYHRTLQLIQVLAKELQIPIPKRDADFLNHQIETYRKLVDAFNRIPAMTAEERKTLTDYTRAKIDRIQFD